MVWPSLYYFRSGSTQPSALNFARAGAIYLTTEMEGSPSPSLPSLSLSIPSHPLSRSFPSPTNAQVSLTTAFIFGSERRDGGLEDLGAWILGIFTQQQSHGVNR